MNAAGNIYAGRNAESFLGKIDEFRISDVARSADWIKATYYSSWDDLITFVDYSTDSQPHTMYMYDFSITVDTVIEDRGLGASVVGNGNDWLLQYNYTTDFMPYMGQYEHTVGGTLIVDYAPEAIVLNTSYDGIAEAGSDDDTIIDTGLTEGDDYWIGALVTITSAGAAAPEGETSICTAFADATDEVTVTPAFSAAVANLDEYTIEFGTLADLEAPAQDARITWGVNPSDVAVALGGMVSSSQPTPGAGIDTPTVDYFPDVEVSDWFEEPDVGVGGALLSNPLRPFVTMMSDTTNMTELQAWRLLGLAMVLLVTVATGVAVKSHQMITGIACSASVGLLVAFTIWPLWALVFIVGGVIGGVIAENKSGL